MWGMVQCAALENTSRVSSMVCIDTKHVTMGKKMVIVTAVSECTHFV